MIRLYDRSWRLRYRPLFLAYGITLVVGVVLAVVSPTSFAPEHVSVICDEASILGLVAASETVVIISGGLDLSVPSMMSVGGVVAARVIENNSQLPVGIGVVLGIAILTGLINGFFVAYVGAPSLIVTLGMSSILAGGLLIVTQGQTGLGTVAPFLQDLAVGSVFGVPTALLVWIALAAVMYLLLSRTMLGRSIYAIGSNRAAAVFGGIAVRRVELSVYVMSAVAGGLGGCLLTGYLGMAYADMGTSYLFIAITAVVIGGASILGGSGHYVGTIAGVLTLTLLTALLTVLDPGPGAQDVIYGAIILIAVAAATIVASRR